MKKIPLILTILLSFTLLCSCAELTGNGDTGSKGNGIPAGQIHGSKGERLDRDTTDAAYNEEKTEESETSNEANNNILVREGTVKTVNVGSLPGYYPYFFTGESAERIVEYLEGLNLSSDFFGNPDEYDGKSWYIILEYEDGRVDIISSVGNKFIHVEGETWYKMSHEEAAKFETLLEELNKIPMDFSENQSLLKYKDGKYVITLPASGRELTVDERFERYLPGVTDELITSAEQAISADVAKYDDNPYYYIAEDGGHLCLATEIIATIDPPRVVVEEDYTISMGCNIDHEHLFFSARISQ